jgi:phage terminase small subunit
VRMRRHVVEDGPVAKPKRNNPKAIARVSPYHQALQDYLQDVVVLEDKLGLSPAHRNKAGKVDRAKKAPRAADQYITAAK